MRLILAIRPRKVLAIASIIVCLALGCPVELVPAPRQPPMLEISRLDISGRTRGAFTLAGAWQMQDGDRRFGGFSGLILQRDGTLAAYSDMGSRLVFGRPDLPSRSGTTPSLVDMPGLKWATDAEAATYDRTSGSTWVALEGANAIRRYDEDQKFSRQTRPPAMATWPANGGPETMVRLPGGRFVVIAESPNWRSPLHRAALLFSGDPTDGRPPMKFWFDPPLGYEPTDATGLPDGRVVILLRAVVPFAFPPFGSKLVIADSAQIEAGRPWPWRELLDVATLAPRENYEGLAASVDGDAATLWLISDSNKSAILQRTLLIKLMWHKDSAGRRPRRALRRQQRPS